MTYHNKMNLFINLYKSHNIKAQENDVIKLASFSSTDLLGAAHIRLHFFLAIGLIFLYLNFLVKQCTVQYLQREADTPLLLKFLPHSRDLGFFAPNWTSMHRPDTFL